MENEKKIKSYSNLELEKKLNFINKIDNSNLTLTNLIYDNKNFDTVGIYYHKKKVNVNKFKANKKLNFLKTKKLSPPNSYRHFREKSLNINTNNNKSRNKIFPKIPLNKTNCLNDKLSKLMQKINNSKINSIKLDNLNKKELFKTIRNNRRSSNLSLKSLDFTDINRNKLKNKISLNNYNKNNNKDYNIYYSTNFKEENKTNLNKNLDTPILLKIKNNSDLEKLLIDDTSSNMKRIGARIENKKDILTFLTELQMAQNKENERMDIFETLPQTNITMKTLPFRNIYDKCKKELLKSENLENFLEIIKKNSIEKYLKNVFEIVTSNNDDQKFIKEQNKEYLQNKKGKIIETLKSKIKKLDIVEKLSSNYAFKDRKRLYNKYKLTGDEDDYFIFSNEIFNLKKQQEKNNHKYMEKTKELDKKIDKVNDILQQTKRDNILVNDKIDKYLNNNK